MPETLRVVWIGSAALVTLALGLAPTFAPAEEPTAAPAASAAPATPGTPFDHGKAADGATKAALCAACHGQGGNSTNPEWPRLAGQSAIYIADQLRMFKAGTRLNPVMQPLVASLTDQDIADLAVYFQGQTPQGLEADPSYWKAGEALYLRGDQATGVPACVACHGVEAVSGGNAPDLRASPIPPSAEAFAGIVHDGGLVANGMPRFEEFDRSMLDALRQYLRSRAADLRDGDKS